MKQLSLSQEYAIIAMDGLESIHSSVAKLAALRSIMVAKRLEEIIDIPEEQLAKFTSKLMEAVKTVKKLNKKLKSKLRMKL